VHERGTLNFQLGTIAGPFRLEAELGRGGMGAVFRATDLRAHRSVALKVVLGAQRDVSVQRFLREAQVVAALRHPGIVGVHDALLLEGVPCIVYELVEGARTLQDAFASLTLAERLELVLEVADALAYVHDQGLVHRDVKPGNVLVDGAGRARLTDFGVVRGADLERLTKTGRLVGTPAYMAPEQIAGERDAVGSHSDVWALGVILYEALTGRLPFEASTAMELAVQVGRSPAPPPSSVSDEPIPEGAEAVCLRALAKAPAARYADGRAFHEALASVLAGTFRAPSRLKWALSGALALTLAGALGLLALRGWGPAAPTSGRFATNASPSQRPRSPEEWRRLGKRLAVDGRWPQAVAALSRVLEADPHDEGARALRGKLLQELGQTEAALTDLEASHAEYPEDAELYYRLAVARFGSKKGWTEPPDLERPVEGPRGVCYRATARYFAGRLPIALADFTLVIERLPKFAPAHHGRGTVRRDLGDLRGALVDFSRAVELRPKLVRYRVDRSACLLKLERPAEALREAEAALKLNPQDLEVYECLAWARRTLEDYEGAAADLKRGLDLAPDTLSLLFQVALLHEAQGDVPKAIAVYEQILVLDPDERATLLNLAVRHLELNHLDRVEAPLRRALAADPHDALTLGNLSAFLTRVGRLKEALETAQRAVDLAPEQAPLSEQLALTLNRVGKHDEALGVLERLLANHPLRARAHYLRSMALHGKQDLAGALQAIERAVALEPESVKYLEERGLHYANSGRFVEAAADLSLAIEKRPTAELYTARGYTLLSTGDEAEGLADFGRALALDPNHEQALVNRSVTLTKGRRHKEALPDLDRLVKIAPKQPSHWLSRANARFNVTDFKGCVRDCERYRKLAPKNPEGPVLEGRAWAVLERRPRANECFDAALALQPKHVMALAHKADTLVALERWAEAVRILDRLSPLLDPTKAGAKRILRLRDEAASHLR
jgi:tetratricopeptide (TPR) repeat protein